MKKFLGIVMIIAGIIIMLLVESSHKDNVKEIAVSGSDMLSVDSSRIDAANDGKLVNLAGVIENSEGATDEDLGIHVPAPRLKRVVETYQWTLDGNFKREWVEEKVSDKNFDDEHKNKYPFQYESADFTSDDAHIGAYKIKRGLLLKTEYPEDLRDTLDDDTVWELIQMAQKAYGEEAHTKIGDGRFFNIFMGRGLPDDPLVGDVRIKYYVYDTCHVSVRGMQSGDSITRYVASDGTEIYKMQAGMKTSEEVIAELKSNDRIVTWCFRVIVFILMLFGFRYCFEMLCTRRWFSAVVANYIKHGQLVVCGAIILIMNFAIATFYAFMYDTIQAAIMLALLLVVLWKIKAAGTRSIRQDFRSCSVDDFDF